MEASLSQDFQMGPGIVHRPRFRSNNHSWIPHLIGPAGVTDCFGCDGGAPFRGWIPPFGDLCVIPIAGDSVAEMPVIRIGEPPPLDSRVRGNDGVGGFGSPQVGLQRSLMPSGRRVLGSESRKAAVLGRAGIASPHVSGIATHGESPRLPNVAREGRRFSTGSRVAVPRWPYYHIARPQTATMSQETRTPTAMGQEQS